jgi:hypothetical protein
LTVGIFFLPPLLLSIRLVCFSLIWHQLYTGAIIFK